MYKSYALPLNPKSDKCIYGYGGMYSWDPALNIDVKCPGQYGTGDGNLRDKIICLTAWQEHIRQGLLFFIMTF